MNNACRAECKRGSRGAKVRKTARRDMPFVIAQGLDGATTVSATMVLAARAGIRVFVTGGEVHGCALLLMFMCYLAHACCAPRESAQLDVCVQKAA